MKNKKHEYLLTVNFHPSALISGDTSEQRRRISLMEEKLLEYGKEESVPIHVQHRMNVDRQPAITFVIGFKSDREFHDNVLFYMQEIVSIQKFILWSAA